MHALRRLGTPWNRGASTCYPPTALAVDAAGCDIPAMVSAEVAWLSAIDFEFLDGRFGAPLVNRLLRDPLSYVEPSPRADADGRLVAALDVDAPERRAGGFTLAVRVRRPDDPLEVACVCSQGGRFVCEHVTRVLVDLAAHPGLRRALASREPSASHVAELPAMRAAALAERTIDERLARWIPSRATDDDIEIDVDVQADATDERRPCVVLRCRRAHTRALLSGREVIDARLTTRHRRLVELTRPSHADRRALVATHAQASLLIHLMRDDGRMMTGGFRRHLRFAKEPASPRVERIGDALVARWCSPDGYVIADAADMLLFTGPFPYVWSSAHHLFRPVAPEVDQDVAWGFHVSPTLPMPAHQAERIGRALLEEGRGRGVVLPPPEAFGLPAIEAPRFVLELQGTPLEVRGELKAVYSIGTVRISPSSDASTDARDVQAEERARILVREAGLAENDDRELAVSEDGAIDFWRSGIERLRASDAPRIEIKLADSILRVKLGAPVRARVEVGVATGWLDTRLDFAAGDVKVEMQALRAALKARKRWVSLADGTLAKITDEIAALVDESAALLREKSEARLAPHHLGRVERWVEEHGGEVDAQVTELRARLRSLAIRSDADLPKQLNATLRPYQIEGVAWLQFLRELGAGGILADDMGLGKTIMTLAFLARWKEDSGRAPSIVVCPTSVVGNWVREAERFTPQLKVLVLHGTQRAKLAPSIPKHDLIITTYGLLRRDVDWLADAKLRCAVLDEAQNVKNAVAATTRAARRLDAEMRIALTGTPVENRLLELWSIMSFVNPGMLGTARDFDERYERPIANDPSGVVAERLRAVVRPFVLRRTKAQVLPDLPPKTEIDRVCVFKPKQKRLYDALALTLRESVKKRVEKVGLNRSSMSVLTAILRLRQMACDPRLVDPTVPAEHSAKRAAFLELVRELADEGRRALVFSQFVELLSLWREDLDRENIAYEYLDGSSTKRDAIVTRFQTGAAPLFLISLKAGGAGLNLTAADTVIHCDPWWNPAVEDQATDRAHRIGQERAVTVVRLVAQGTIEEKIGLLKGKKRELAKAVISADAGALRGLDEADVRDLLGDVEGDVDADPA